MTFNLEKYIIHRETWKTKQKCVIYLLEYLSKVTMNVLEFLNNKSKGK